MVSNTPTEGRCNAGAGENKDGFCEAWPVTDRNGDPRNGRCRMHGGNNTGSDGRGAPEGNQNALQNDGGGAPIGNNNRETHGMSAKAENWYSNHWQEVDEEVQQLTDVIVNHIGFEYGVHDFRIGQIMEIVVMQKQMEKGNKFIESEGVMKKEKVATQDGVVFKDSENPALKAKSRLFRDIQKGLKDYGLLEESPEMQSAQAEQSISDAWREALAERTGDTEDKETSESGEE